MPLLGQKSTAVVGFQKPSWSDIWKKKKSKKINFCSHIVKTSRWELNICRLNWLCIWKNTKLLCKHCILEGADCSCFVSFAVTWLFVPGNEWFVLPGQRGQHGAAVRGSLTFTQVRTLQLRAWISSCTCCTVPANCLHAMHKTPAKLGFEYRAIFSCSVFGLIWTSCEQISEEKAIWVCSWMCRLL